MAIRTVAAALAAGAVALSGCASGAHAPTVDRHLLDDGRHVFVTAGCGGCHTLSTAGTHGVLGPNFDTSERLSSAQVRRQLHSGVGGMPSFRGRLTGRQEEAVSAFLADAMRRRARR